MRDIVSSWLIQDLRNGSNLKYIECALGHSISQTTDYLRVINMSNKTIKVLWICCKNTIFEIYNNE